MIIRYPELQSGFVAYPSEKGLIRPEPVQLTPVGLIIQPKPTRTSQDYFYSMEVEELMHEVVNNPFAVRKLQFQARIFEACGILFDRKGIYSFMVIQEEGKHISPMHRNFLKDTLGAVLCGMPRMMEPVQWAPNITVANEPSRSPFKASSVTSELGVRPPESLDQFLQMWVESVGILDLVMSLQVFFGRRTLHASNGAPKR